MIKSNFSGVWELIQGKSDFGYLPAPRLRIDTITHEASRFQVRTRQKDANGDLTIERDLVIGGPPAEITIKGRARQIHAAWRDGELVVVTSSEVSGSPRTIEDRWASVDEDSLTITRVHELPGGPVRQLLFMRRV